MAVHSLFFSTVKRDGVTESRFEWNVINHYFFSTEVIEGLGVTLALTAVAMVGGVLIGVLLSIMRLSPNPIVTGSSWIYIWFFRGTPVLVQLLFWYNAAYIFPSFTLGVPFGPALVHFNLNSWLTPFVAAGLGLALNEGATDGPACDRVAAGDASSDPAHGQRDHLDAEDVVSCFRSRGARAVVPCRANIRGQLLRHTFANGGKSSVPVGDIGAHGRSVLP
jgi:polar amino acid transport system permease protein